MAKNHADQRATAAFLLALPAQPRRRGPALAVLQYALLACALFALAGCAAMHAADKIGAGAARNVKG